MFIWTLGGLGALFSFASDAVSSAVGWAWDKVIQGIYSWLANGLALLIEWVWSVLDSASTPRLSQGWFQNDLAARVGLIGLAVVIALMLASATQAALAGRPEQIGDAVKEGVKAIVASALTLTALDVLIGVTDEAAAAVWQVGRADLVTMIEGMVAVATTTGALGVTFVGPLCLLFGFVGLIGLVVALMMRSALIYVAAALAPLVWSTNVLPTFRGSARKLVHLLVALVVSKLAIVVTLVVAVKLIANPSSDPNSGAALNDGAAAVGTLMTGFVCFLIAAVTPFVLYKLMPTVEGAMVASGIAGGWGRSLTTAAHTALMVKSLGASKGVSAATRPVAGQAGVPGSGQTPSNASNESTSPVPPVQGFSGGQPAKRAEGPPGQGPPTQSPSEQPTGSGRNRHHTPPPKAPTRSTNDEKGEES